MSVKIALSIVSFALMIVFEDYSERRLVCSFTISERYSSLVADYFFSS
jgi:hypothetical protein